MANTEIQLTAEEREVFGLLMGVVRERAPSTVVRVCGGWIRDKLLGIRPKDMDLMVDNITGPDFARLVALAVGGKAPAVIKENPEKSRHVETAKVRIPTSLGERELDVAMCRKEVYDENSRIPTEVSRATPQEDSLRRDLTVNALFLNLSNMEIEDFTGHGLDDLGAHILRAPGNPVVRFLEDPLRVFRIARFSSRYGWDVDPATLAAMGDPKVLGMMEVKTAPDRIGEELKALLSEPHADRGLAILQGHGILDRILGRAVSGTEYEGRLSPFVMDQRSSYHDMNVWDHTLATVRGMMREYPVSDPERRMVMLLSALGHDFGKLFQGIQATTEEGHGSYHGHEDHSRELLKHLLKHLRMDRMVPEVGGMAAMHMRPYALVDAGPKAIRKFLRQLAETGVRWVDLINMALSDVTAKAEMGDAARATMDDLLSLKGRIAQVEEEMGRMGVVQSKPLLNGGEIMAAFGNRKPGAWIGTVQRFVEDLVDTDPSTTKEAAAGRAKGQFPEFVGKDNEPTTRNNTP